MKQKALILIAIIAMTLSACNKIVTEESHPIADNNWLRFEPEAFDFNIKNTEDCYNIIATIRIDTNMIQLKEFPLVVNINTAGGETRMFYAHIPLVDKNGKRTGSVTGAYQLAEARIREYLYFSTKGNVHVEMKQGTHKYELPGVAMVGLRVEKSDMSTK